MVERLQLGTKHHGELFVRTNWPCKDDVLDHKISISIKIGETGLHGKVFEYSLEGIQSVNLRFGRHKHGVAGGRPWYARGIRNGRC